MTGAQGKTRTEDPFEELIRKLESLRDDVIRYADSHSELLEALPENRRASARNLLHYLALRKHDIRPLQEQLALVGLSSIGRAESNVQATLDSVIQNLGVLSGHQRPGDEKSDVYAEFQELSGRLDENTVRLLGDRPVNRRVRIMVTMPLEAATDYMMVHRLMEGGMDCIRINCAHGDRENWAGIIDQKQNAERVMGRSCKVLLDLRGPKLRTGPMEPAPAVLKVRPVRDDYGLVVRPARIWLSADPEQGNECGSADACLKIPGDWLGKCEVNDKVRFKDARGSKRRWRIMEVSEFGCWAESEKTSYLLGGTRLKLPEKAGEAELSELPVQQSVLIVRVGDTLQLINSEEPGKPSLIDRDGVQLRPGKISLPIPEVYRDTRPGDRIGFDDGRISGIVEKVEGKKLQVRITHTRKPVEKLPADKGINLPDTLLDLPALSAEDIADLEFVASNADIIGLSFTNTPDDVRELRDRLQELEAEDVGVVFKIETRRGFENLPAILLEALKFPACGVMIARGDLAAECGFERMAELQEEILWICESAHVPVVWATQVLEGLTKRGHATRAEITDAAMGQSAECVMLNKGPYVADALQTLNDILQRMQDHQTKKRSMLRKLSLAADFTATRQES